MSKRESSPQLRYWDSCVFIHLIQGNEPGAGSDIKTLARHAKEGKIIIVTSTLTIAEVVKPSKNTDPTALDENDKRRIQACFVDDSIKIVDVTQFIAERAREIQWGVGVKPADAIHLATAEYSKSQFFDTTDEKSVIKKVEEATGFVWNHEFHVGFPVVDAPELDLRDEQDT